MAEGEEPLGGRLPMDEASAAEQHLYGYCALCENHIKKQKAGELGLCVDCIENAIGFAEQHNLLEMEIPEDALKEMETMNMILKVEIVKPLGKWLLEKYAKTNGKFTRGIRIHAVAIMPHYDYHSVPGDCRFCGKPQTLFSQCEDHCDLDPVETGV